MATPFFYCYIARSIRRIICIALKIDRHANIKHIIGSWQTKKRKGTQKKPNDRSGGYIFGYYGFVETMLFLTINKYHPLCRLFYGEPTVSDFGD